MFRVTAGTRLLNQGASRRLGLAVAAAGLLGAASGVRAVPAVVLTDENDLFLIDTGTPQDIVSGGAILGLNGQDLIGIDFRPANGTLYGVGNFGGIFRIDLGTRAATLVSTVSVPLQGTRFGVDFNPVPDRLRLVSDTEQSLRVNVDTGAATVDGSLSYGPGQPGATGDNPSVTAAAYTNSRAGATTTTLYGIDVRDNEDRLVIQNPPNDGVLTVVGPLGVNVSAVNGFDIFTNDAGANIGLAALQLVDGGISRLYTINLTTGTATVVGDLGGGDLIDGFAVVPEPTGLALLGVGAGVMALRRRRR